MRNKHSTSVNSFYKESSTDSGNLNPYTGLPNQASLINISVDNSQYH